MKVPTDKEVYKFRKAVALAINNSEDEDDCMLHIDEIGYIPMSLKQVEGRFWMYGYDFEWRKNGMACYKDGSVELHLMDFGDFTLIGNKGDVPNDCEDTYNGWTMREWIKDMENSHGQN